MTPTDRRDAITVLKSRAQNMAERCAALGDKGAERSWRNVLAAPTWSSTDGSVRDHIWDTFRRARARG